MEWRKTFKTLKIIYDHSHPEGQYELPKVLTNCSNHQRV